MLRPVSVPAQYTEDNDHHGVQRRDLQMFGGWSTCPVRRGWGTRALLSWERRQPWGHQIAAPVWGAIKKSEMSSSEHCKAEEQEKTGWNQERFKWCIKWYFSPTQWQRGTGMGPREVVLSLALEAFNTQQDQALWNLVPPHRWSRHEISWGLSQPELFCGFLSHRRKSIWCLTQRGFMSPMLGSVSFLPRTKRIYFHLKPRNTLRGTILGKNK